MSSFYSSNRSPVIDLCDSDQDEDIKDVKPAPLHDDDSSTSSSSSSSSSSDDDILYTPGIFSQENNASTKSGLPSMTAKKTGVKTTDVYFNRKYANPKMPVTVKEDHDEDKPENDPQMKSAAPPVVQDTGGKTVNDYHSKFERKRDVAPSTPKSAVMNTTKKSKQSDAYAECIEIDLSSDDDETPKKISATNANDADALSHYFSHSDFANKVSKKTQVHFYSSDDNASVNSIKNTGINWLNTSSRNNSISQQCRTVQNPYNNPYKSNPQKKPPDFNSYLVHANRESCAEHDSKVPNESATPKTGELVLNEPNRSKNPLTHAQYDSDASSATVPLSFSEEIKSSTQNSTPERRKKEPPKEIDLSVDTSDDDGSCSSIHTRPLRNKLETDKARTAQEIDSVLNNQITSEMKKSVEFSFEIHGGFDSEDESDNERDEISAEPNEAMVRAKKSSIDNLHTKCPAKPKPNESKSLSLKGRVDNDLLDLDSVDSSCSASPSIPLFTPRPFKRKTKGSIRTPNAAATAVASAISSSKAGQDLSTAPSSSPELMTPREFSPPSTSPLTSFAAKRKVPTPNIPALPKELINEIGGKLYPDLRHSFLVKLASHARKLRHASYERGSFDSALRSIIVIGLHLRPLRSPEAARRIKGVGGNFYDLLKESTGGPDAQDPFVPKQNKYSCVAAAALVALLELEEENKSVAPTDGQCFPMESLICKTNQLLDPRAKAALNETVEKYLDPNTLDPGWGQVKKLCSTNAASELGGPFVKERKKKNACESGVVFELLESGREMAIKLRQLAEAGPVEPGPLRQLPNDTVDEEFGSVTMSMDHREGGGAGKSLHKMCDQLDIRGVPYVVRELKIADYVFFVGDKLAPILIERKTADDVAGSLHDGRWERQQRSMRKAQYVLGGGEARKCQICYIIEGDANKRKVHGGNVGRRSWFQSVEDVENAIERLPLLGFGVMRSKGHLDTIGILAKVASDVSWKVNNGIIDAKFTYQQFLSRVRTLSDDKGDPPTDREHQNPAPPIVVNANHIPRPATNPVGDDGSCPTSTAHQNVAHDSQEDNCEAIAELKKLSMQALKERCKDRGEKMGGKKEELIARLLKPRKPEILIMRARRNEYVPKVPSSNAALMVALLLHHTPGTQGLTKERLMVLAEETGVSKESMSGDGGFYDGWSGIKLLQEGDPALVRREKGHRYSLTTQPPELSGLAVANALHILAHREQLCTCGASPE